MLVADIQPALDQGLQPACARNAWQCPAGEGQQSFAGAAGDDELAVAQYLGAVGVFQQQLAGGGYGCDAEAAEQARLAVGQLAEGAAG